MFGAFFSESKNGLKCSYGDDFFEFVLLAIKSVLDESILYHVNNKLSLLTVISILSYRASYKFKQR